MCYFGPASSNNMAPVRGRKTPQKQKEADGIASTSTGRPAGTLNQLLEVVTSVTQGLEYEDEGQLAEIFPDLSVDFIKVASATQAQLKEQEEGPVTRARQGQMHGVSCSTIFNGQRYLPMISVFLYW